MKQLLQHDNLCTRREVHLLLEKLPPAYRVAWLRRCCARATLGNSRVRPCVPPYHKGSAMEAYADFWALISSYKVDDKACLEDLVQTVRKYK